MFVIFLFLQIGLEGGNALKVDEKVVVNDARPGEAKPFDVKPIDGAANNGLNLKADEPAKPAEGEVKRQEPPVPHAPKDNLAQNVPDQRHGEEVHLNEKRQLMSRSEDEKGANSVKAVVEETKGDNVVAARNVAGANQVKVSEEEIEEELRRLEHSDKVI